MTAKATPKDLPEAHELRGSTWLTSVQIPFAVAECLVLRHALMSYRNGLVERNRESDPYPMSDGLELVTADDLIARLDNISAAYLQRDRETSNVSEAA